MAFLIVWSSYAILIGIFKGLGIHQSAAFFTFFLNFGVSIPLAIFMEDKAFKYLKLDQYKYLNWIHDVAGLNFGYSIGLLILNIILLRILCTLNWKDTSKEIHQNFLEVEESIQKNLEKLKNFNNMIIKNQY